MKGYIEYKRREYCNDIGCRIQNMMNKNSQDSDDLREICQNNCLHSTYEFHHWLVEKGYLLVRPEQNIGGT